MADENDGQKKRLGPFELGASHPVGSGLGRIHEARHVVTGKPALVLLPDSKVEWPFDEPCRMTLSGLAHPPALIMEVHQAPASAPVTGMTNLATMAASSTVQLEDTAQVDAHVSKRRIHSDPSGDMSAGSYRYAIALAAMAVLSAGAGFWMHVSENTQHSRLMTSSDFSRFDAPGSTNWTEVKDEAVAYPLPSEPFRNQAKAPCVAKADEVEINGGCWVELAKRPPCGETSAEHQGKCYMPMNKDRGGQPPRSNKP